MVFVVGPADEQPSLTMRMLEDALNYAAHIGDNAYVTYMMSQYATTELSGQMQSILTAVYPQEIARLERLAQERKALTRPDP